MQHSLAECTTFGIGGPADLFAVPLDAADLERLLRAARRMQLPISVLGGGANVLVSDRGIRGLVVSMRCLDDWRIHDGWAELGAGLPVNQAARGLASAGYGGIEFLYAMPGSIGGAVWMNARCYGSSIAETLVDVTFIDTDGLIGTVDTDLSAYGYKRSPFQNSGRVILKASVRLRQSDSAVLLERMREIEHDRQAKGHFDAPSAGSVFKNDHRLGAPMGAIIDRLGLKGLRVGGAQVSPRHGNIIINTGGASARDVRCLVDEVSNTIEQATGLRPEPEIIFLGEWSDAD